MACCLLFRGGEGCLSGARIHTPRQADDVGVRTGRDAVSQVENITKHKVKEEIFQSKRSTSLLGLCRTEIVCPSQFPVVRLVSVSRDTCQGINLWPSERTAREDHQLWAHHSPYLLAFQLVDRHHPRQSSRPCHTTSVPANLVRTAHNPFRPRLRPPCAICL